MSQQAQLIPISHSEVNDILNRMDPSRKVWYDPREKMIYRGQAGDLYGSSAIASRPFTDDTSNIYDAAVKKGVEELLDGKLHYGGITDTSTIQTIKAVTVLDQLLGISFRQYKLAGACMVVTTPTLEYNADVATKFTGATNILPLVEAPIKTDTYTRFVWNLASFGKNVASIALADEGRKQAVHDVWAGSIRNAAGEIQSMRNAHVETVLAAVTAQTGESDWGNMTANGDFSASNPMVDIQAAITTIESNGYTADRLVVHPRAWGDFLSNTFSRDQIISGVREVDAGVVRFLGFPDLQVIVDQGRLNTSAVVNSTTAPNIILVDGPTEAAQYRDELRGMDGYIVRQWTQAKEVIAGAGREITGISA